MTAPDPKAMRKFLDAAVKAVADGTEFVLEAANRTVPIEEGTLARSGAASHDDGRTGTITGVVSYDTPYAARQHEDTRLRHSPGRRAKWLQSTLAEQKDAVGAHIAKELAAVK